LGDAGMDARPVATVMEAEKTIVLASIFLQQ
jgi:hypothetical protein